MVEEAEDLLDEVGAAQFTLAALADRLGVRQPSLYKHVDGLDGLQRAVSVRAKLELGDVLARAAVGRARGDAITAMCGAYRRWALDHPGRYAATVRAPAPEDDADNAASAAVVRVVLDVLAGYGLEDDDAVDAARAIRASLHGFVALESGGGFGLPTDIGRSFDRLVAGLVAALDTGATA